MNRFLVAVVALCFSVFLAGVWFATDDPAGKAVLSVLELACLVVSIAFAIFSRRR